ncbi:MAG: D-alanyl-D-alanine carboxypeptidase [Burkholderiaceae bacterium]|jgi:D-alanyl-D-alanine carboxypeptidase (penicillin-binding protein 5/6)|uniref:serine-type D-Ala-D-Ala carboxypeptidase n=1 Tax=Herminiimonas contaminans TaxID=1111140 RepID=A0ABS0EUN3_9BURK|nr:MULTISPECIES: D-alanyl-D-alanine carboxypeptidase family protein [Oxalobacteraceae]MBF8178545.1 D-alanyl-D-alanine carboxypeptidase [Herminiimonas contaminans]MBX9798199.1 D-alanyl-D-alanine carboxypeptidase [Burkholderiaceae bacterium]
MKKLLAAIAATVLSLSSAFAQSVPSPTIAAKSWLLLDATSNQVLASNEPDMRIEPASLTKLMTAYVAFTAIQDKKLDLNQMITISTNAWKVDPSSSKMFIEPRVPVKVNDLLYGLIVQSGNDAAVAIAEAVAGTEDAFVALMNREAERMGMKSTHFANPHGLPSASNYSTARDLSVLASHLINDHPEFYKIYSTKEYTYNNIKQPNRNRLLWLDPTVDGMKTGYTQGAGYCLISTAKRPNGTGERRLISVVLGTISDQARAQESQKLLNWGFLNFDTVKLYAKNEPIATPNVWKGTQNTVKIGFTRDVYVTVPKGVANSMKPVLARKDPLVAPIDKNSQVGTIKVMSADGKVVSELPVLALEQVGQAGLFGRALDSIRLWVH